MISALTKKAKEVGLAGIGFAPAIDEVREAFEWAESVVCAAVSYLPPERDVSDDRPRGLVARVARGPDYHTVLREKLTVLAEVIREAHPGARVEVYVDTDPLPERKLAMLAGIGWRGKNGCVYVEGCGSWVALGEIVTDVQCFGICAPLKSRNTESGGSRRTPEGAGSPRTPIDRCGDCRRCMDACPTGAILGPCEIDCGRCLSAVTQVSGSIHADLRAAMGNRIYGCDVCQEVCPQNAGIVPITPEFAVDRFPGAHPEIVPLISMTAQEFKAKVKDSPIGWIRRTRIRRNAAIAAGNLRCKDAIPALTEMLSDGDPVLREAAEWALAQMGKEVQTRSK